jgi:hypothetical protein
MKQMNIATQPTVQSASGAATEKPAANRANGAALQSAEPVVAAPGRKKPAGRVEIGPAPVEVAGSLPQKPGLAGAVGDSVIGRANVDNTGASGALAPDADARTKGAPDFLHPTPSRLPGSPGKVAPEARCDMHGAVAFDARDKGNEVTPDKPPQRHWQWTGTDAEIGTLPQAGEDVPPEMPTTTGIDDRVPYLALTAGAATPTLRPPKMASTSTVKPLLPKSRAECRRRCGSDGFCDPSSELGCGGVHCGRKYDGV